jgi:hypothetical protein
MSNQPIRFEPVGEGLIRANFGDSIRKKKSGSKYPKPENHFLLFVRDGQPLDPRRMWDQNIKDVAQSESHLFQLAKGPEPTACYLGRGFDNMLWEHPCYVTVILDNDNYYFNWDDNDAGPDGDPILFIAKVSGKQYDPNHTFYNAVRVDVPILDQSGQVTGYRKGVRFENHIKDDNENRLPHKATKRYKMDLMVWRPNSTGGHTLVKIDPDGTNQGPPGVP